LWRGVEEPVPSVAEGTPAMLVCRCSCELSGRKRQRKIKKSQTPSKAEESAVPWTLPGKMFSTERTRISRHAAPDTATYAPFLKERRIMLANATNFHRKSGA
jgi:hypothetical protein